MRTTGRSTRLRITYLPEPPNLTNPRRAVRRRFHRALRDLQERAGLSAKEISVRCHLPHRTVLNWLNKKACPGPARLKELCGVFGWHYDQLFNRAALEGESFEDQYLDYRKLSERYLTLRPTDPLQAWAHIPLAGALVFVDLSAAGFECRAITAHHFGTLIEFINSKSVTLQVRVIFERGLVVSWYDEQGLVRETMDLSESNVKMLVKNLREVAGL